MKKIIFTTLMLILFIPGVKAEEIILTKYYKTTMINSSNIATRSGNSNFGSITVEITEEEYNNASVIEPLSSSTIETNYKKMTISMTSNGAKYLIKGTLNWKNMPKVRSYDIFGLGFPTSVKKSGDVTFKQEYTQSGTNYISSTFSGTSSSTGYTAIFKLPTSTKVTALKQTIQFNIEKNVAATLTNLTIAADYAHATSSVTLTNAKKHTMTNGGLTLNTLIVDDYDTTPVAKLNWTGQW